MINTIALEAHPTMKKSNFQTTTTIAILLLAAGDRVAFGFVSPIGRIPKTSCSHHENNKPKVIRTILDPRLMMSLSTKEKDKEKETKSAILISEEPSQLHRVEVDDHRQFAVSDPHANRSEPSRDLRFTNGRLIVGNNENDEDANNRLENWVDESKHVELVALSIWMAVISAFVLINNFIGPFPSAVIMAVPERTWFFGHMLGGMLFGGGILMTTAIEYMVAETKDASVLQFWFDKVPLLDSAMVLPGLTLAMVSGVSLSVQHCEYVSTLPQCGDFSKCEICLPHKLAK